MLTIIFLYNISINVFNKRKENKMELSEFTEEKNDGACFAGQPVDNTKEELLQALKDAFRKVVEDRQEYLLEECPEDYTTGRKTDCGYFNNGVGFAPCGAEEEEMDEDQALEDAKEGIIHELVNCDIDTIIELFDDNKFTIALGAFLKGC